MFNIFKLLIFYYISWLIIIMYYEKNIIKFKIFEVDDIFWEMCLGELYSVGWFCYIGKMIFGFNRWKV